MSNCIKTNNIEGDFLVYYDRESNVIKTTRKKKISIVYYGLKDKIYVHKDNLWLIKHIEWGL